MAISPIVIESGIIAHAGGGLESATALTKAFNFIATVATDHDSVVLPAMVAGTRIGIYNGGVALLDIYPPSAGIDDEDAAEPYVLQPGMMVRFTAKSATAIISDNPMTKTVTQGTSIVTGVTIDALHGIITTVAATAGANGATPNVFTVTNKFARSGSNLVPYILDYAGTHATNGNPEVSIDTRTNGTFDIVISSGGANALNGILKIGFMIIN